jgi:hypothetical protein
VRLRPAAPGEVGAVIIEGKKRRIIVAVEGPPRSSRFAKKIYKGQRKGEEAQGRSDQRICA